MNYVAGYIEFDALYIWDQIYHAPYEGNDLFIRDIMSAPCTHVPDCRWSFYS